MDLFVLGVIGAILAVPLLGAAVILGARGYWTSRGSRLVRCPQDGVVARVELSSWWSGLMTMLGRDKMVIGRCSHWPETRRCDQGCLRQIETSAIGCREEKIIASWVDGRSCPLCGCELDSARMDRVAYTAADGSTSPLRDLASEDLVRLFWSCEPVCWDCHVAKTTSGEQTACAQTVH